MNTNTSRPQTLAELLTPLRSLDEILSPEDVDLLRNGGVMDDEEHDFLTTQQERRRIDSCWVAEVTLCARELCREANQSLAHARKLRANVIAYGGISDSDYESLPDHYKRVSPSSAVGGPTGLSMDALATELDYPDSEALYHAILGAENLIRQLPVIRGRRVRQYRVEDFQAAAAER